MIRSFSIHTPRVVIDDLKSRVINTRWPDEITDSGWTYGASMSYMRELADYWTGKFDWRKTEDQINSYPNYIADIEGYKIHFIHVRGKGSTSVPLILTHGWPGSFLEMIKLIPFLTSDHEYSFDLVIPSMPGYGFSEKIIKQGCNVRLMGDLWHKLMKELGYEKFGAQGGDFGAGVSTAMAMKYPEDLVGIHLNYIPGSYKPFISPGDTMTPEEIHFEASLAEWDQVEGAYGHQHATRPLSLAYGLNDSPVGLAGWIIEKFYYWADCKGNVESVFSKDELLSQVTLYWLTETIHSSIRLYHENSKAPFHFSQNDYVKIPVGIARFPLEEPFPPRSYIKRGYNIQHWTDMPAGGHFAAMEQPELLAGDIRNFFSKII